jgi:hypothetical protein
MCLCLVSLRVSQVSKNNLLNPNHSLKQQNLRHKYPSVQIKNSAGELKSTAERSYHDSCITIAALQHFSIIALIEDWRMKI